MMAAEELYVESQVDEDALASYRQAEALARQLPAMMQVNLARSILGIVGGQQSLRTHRGRKAATNEPRNGSAPTTERLVRPLAGNSEPEPRNPLVLIEQLREEHGWDIHLSEAQIQQLVEEYQKEVGRTFSDKELARLLLKVRLEYEVDDDYEPPNRKAFREWSNNRPASGPSPTDEEIEQWLDEYRTERWK